MARYLRHQTVDVVSTAELHGIGIDPTSAALLAQYPNAYIETISKGIFTLALRCWSQIYFRHRMVNIILSTQLHLTYRYISHVGDFIDQVPSHHRMVEAVSTMGVYLIAIASKMDDISAGHRVADIREISKWLKYNKYILIRWHYYLGSAD